MFSGWLKGDLHTIYILYLLMYISSLIGWLLLFLQLNFFYIKHIIFLSDLFIAHIFVSLHEIYYFKLSQHKTTNTYKKKKKKVDHYLTHWVWMLYCHHVARNTGIRLTLLDTAGYVACSPGTNEHSCTVTSIPPLCNVIFFICINIYFIF